MNFQKLYFLVQTQLLRIYSQEDGFSQQSSILFLKDFFNFSSNLNPHSKYFRHNIRIKKRQQLKLKNIEA